MNWRRMPHTVDLTRYDYQHFAGQIRKTKMVMSESCLTLREKTWSWWIFELFVLKMTAKSKGLIFHDSEEQFVCLQYLAMD